MGEVYDLLVALGDPFKSIIYGRVRELVTAAQMPACDIAGGSATSLQRAGYTEWSTPITIIIRTQDNTRRTATNDARKFARASVEKLANTTGVYYDVFRNFSITTSDEDSAGNGKTIHVAVIQFTARKDS
jgi:hypothetical protein